MNPARVGLAIALGLSAAPGAARADAPVDSAIDVQLFEYAIGPRSFLTVADADLSTRDQVSADFLLTYLTDPFTIYNYDQETGERLDERTEVVKSLLSGELSGAYGISNRLQVGAALPMVFSITGDGLDPATGNVSTDGLQATGLGDMRLEGKYLLRRQNGFRMAGLAGITLPTSFGAGGSDYLGDNLPSLRGRIAMQWRNEKRNLSVGVNAGLILRKPREVYASDIGQQLTYGLASAYSVNNRVSVVGEIFGRTGITDPKVTSSPLELDGAVRIRATNTLALLAGGGAGLVEGIGSPGVRVFFAVGWAPDFRDSDGDGIPNLHDKCPLQAEDFDGLADGDGCPEDDFDGDNRPDETDKCPEVAEDFDAFADEDGCPDTDNDEDGIPDLQDRCPNEPEDRQGKYPEDGCPLSRRDSDGDGFSDAKDRCPDEPEDEDGFEDLDGCPDADNDGDGLADSVDKCPNCAEDADGIDDDDGCPDVETLAALRNNMIEIDRPLSFRRGNMLTPESLEVIDAIAAIMQKQPDVEQWLIVVALPKGGSKAATEKTGMARAQAIKRQLIARGMAEELLQAVGAVAGKEKIRIAVRKGKLIPIENSCPEEFRAVPREAAQGGGTKD